MLPLCDETRRIFAPITREFRDGDTIDISLNGKGNFIFDIYCVDGNARYSASRAVFLLLERFPEKKIVVAQKGQYYTYEVAATDVTVEILNQVAPDGLVKFKDEETLATYQKLLLQSKLDDQIAGMVAAYKSRKEVPQHDFELCAEHPLSAYQQVALCAQQYSAGFGLFMEQGTGKTPVMIASICNLGKKIKEADPSKFARIIVVCPNSVRRNWAEELSTFATRSGRVTVVRGTQLDRVKLLIDAFAPDETGEVHYSVVILGYQTLWRSWECLKMIPWDLAILDEGQGIKDSKAKQSKCCLELRDNAKQRAILTGTPVANSIMDLYMPLEFIERGGSGFSSEKEFRRFYGVYDNQGGRQVLIGNQNLPIMQERLARKSFFISKAEALPDLPDKVYDLIECEMSPQQADFYQKLAVQLALEIEAEMSRDDISRQMIVTNILTKLLRLNQITSGFVSWSAVTDENGDTLQPAHYEYFDRNPKVEAVIAELLAKTDPTEKTIIWACWLPDVAYLQHACNEYGIGNCVIKGVGGDYTEADRAEAVRRFNEDRDCRVCIGTAASGGAGLNLLGYPPRDADNYDTDCTHIMYFSQTWSRLHRAQSEDRAHRRGTRRNVRISDIVIPNTIDEEIRTRVFQKTMNALDIGDLRQILANIASMQA